MTPAPNFKQGDRVSLVLAGTSEGTRMMVLSSRPSCHTSSKFTYACRVLDANGVPSVMMDFYEFELAPYTGK